MNTKTLISGLAGGIVLFFAGYLIYGVLMANYFKADMPSYPGLLKEPMEIWPIALGNIFWGIVLAWILNFGGVVSAGRGASTAALIFFLISLGYSFVSYGQMNLYSIQGIFAEAVCMAVMTAIGGAVIGWILGRPSKG
jgi:hypothetical protein